MAGLAVQTSRRKQKHPKLALEKAVLWFASKRMLPDSKLSDYVGMNEKTKVCH